jgi:hypothetical protein
MKLGGSCEKECCYDIITNISCFLFNTSHIIVGLRTKLGWIIFIKHFGTVFCSLYPEKYLFKKI